MECDAGECTNPWRQEGDIKSYHFMNLQRTAFCLCIFQQDDTRIRELHCFSAVQSLVYNSGVVAIMMKDKRRDRRTVLNVADQPQKKLGFRFRTVSVPWEG